MDTKNRIIKSSIDFENGRAFVDSDEEYYNILIKEFIFKGKDGFDMLPGSESVIDSSNLDTARNS